MTTPWTIDPALWAGETVAILGAGPSMTTELAQTARGHKTIAVNRAVQFAPWADMFIALDACQAYWDAADRVGFVGLRVCGVACDIDALYPGPLYETVAMGPGHTIEVRNNTLAAIRIAARAGAKRIILLGIDAPRYEAIHANTGFTGLVAGLAQITAELQAAGIAVDLAEQGGQGDSSV